MADVVSIGTRITFGNDKFLLSGAVLINPAEILDEKSGLYRISIGRLNESVDAPEYQELFNKVESQMPFVEDMHIHVDGNELIFKLAYVTKSNKPYGTFYDIEATEKDLVYKKGT